MDRLYSILVIIMGGLIMSGGIFLIKGENTIFVLLGVLSVWIGGLLVGVGGINIYLFWND